MSRTTARQQTEIITELSRLGFHSSEILSLCRISRVLHTWGEHECNGAIQRDDKTNKPAWHNTYTGERIGFTSDREAGALVKAKRIVEQRNHRTPGDECTFYHQSDPRGAAVYIIRNKDIIAGAEIGSCYSRGVAVY